MAALAGAVPVTGYPSVLLPLIVAVGVAIVNPLTPTLIGALGSLSGACATTVTVSPSETSGTSTVQLPSSSASPVTGSSPGIVTVTVAPGSAVPLIVVSPALIGSMVGNSVCSSSSAGTVIGVAGLRYSSPPAVTIATTDKVSSGAASAGAMVTV